MKKGKIPGFVLFILICLALNWGGDVLISRLNWPIWLDAVGTVFFGYLFGPVCGAMLGVTSNLLAFILRGVPGRKRCRRPCSEL